MSHATIPLPDWREMTPDAMRSAAAEFLAEVRRRHTVRPDAAGGSDSHTSCDLCGAEL